MRGLRVHNELGFRISQEIVLKSHSFIEKWPSNIVWAELAPRTRVNIKDLFRETERIFSLLQKFLSIQISLLSRLRQQILRKKINSTDGCKAVLNSYKLEKFLNSYSVVGLHHVICHC